MSNEALTQRVHSALAIEMQSVADQAYDMLVAKAENPRIPEDVFRHHFLPFYSGQGDPDPKRNVIAEWVGVAGSPTIPVDVFDNETKEVLFTVPPVIETTNLRLTNAAGKSLSELHREHSIQKSTFPGAGERFVATVVMEKARSIAGSAVSTANAQAQWGKIFDYYDINGPDGKPAGKDTIDTNTEDLYDFG